MSSEHGTWTWEAATRTGSHERKKVVQHIPRTPGRMSLILCETEEARGTWESSSSGQKDSEGRSEQRRLCGFLGSAEGSHVWRMCFLSQETSSAYSSPQCSKCNGHRIVVSPLLFLKLKTCTGVLMNSWFSGEGSFLQLTSAERSVWVSALLGCLPSRGRHASISGFWASKLEDSHIYGCLEHMIPHYFGEKEDAQVRIKFKEKYSAILSYECLFLRR